VSQNNIRTKRAIEVVGERARVLRTLGKRSRLAHCLARNAGEPVFEFFRLLAQTRRRSNKQGFPEKLGPPLPMGAHPFFGEATPEM
jgi:hypothetical protein